MAKYQLLLPKMGESVAEATVIKWTKSLGDYIEIDEAVMEIATDKVDSEVPSPVAGKLVEQLYKEDDVVQVGAAIAVIETDPGNEEEPTSAQQAPVAVTPPPSTPQEAKAEDDSVVSDIPGLSQLERNKSNAAEAEVPKASAGKFENRFYSPLVKSIALQEGINTAELDSIPGTGAEGRLTKDDLLKYLEHRTAGSSPKPAAQPKPVEQGTPAQIQEPEQAKAATNQQAAVEGAKPASKPAVSVSGGDEIIEMDRMRKLIADHMVYSKHTSPHVTSFVEVDVTELVEWRDKVKGPFEKREGQKLTLTPIFIEAVVKAIIDMPMINISVSGTQIIKKKNINISMATALPNGNLIVPVIKRADELSLLGLAKSVNDLANRARIGKLLPDDVKDGTFTITNVGTFGNVMGTPIINQPQVAILAVGAIKKKPAVIETPQGDAIGIRHMMFLSLSYDHRVVDGMLGGRFVRKVGDYLEKWDINRTI
ncbi:2-oxo acid dehydrogenase subunit E2 [Mucilaginibacter terrenus]|uniref:Dihydrolipoamide acetyltransferase component of pyruvate dehydrogenase complex n=1 Tax=Mucilaginibacter terrenus TaxID=2482727 RepID=A0A3E2NUX2_9SPHI|nr:dihydrolipoamide acetyltransferase family protein [Mucilaginibacter terrenus]RFZ84711.1 2-oxo acid dehydrogenase subunit E2 [Mucilaginibacter terrenus]